MIKVFITNTKAYNEGKIIGEWVDLFEITKEELKEKINEILRKGGGEEVFISDYESTLENLEIEEFTNIFELKNFIDELPEDEEDIDKIDFLLSQGYSIEDALDIYDYTEYYPRMTLEDVAEELVDDGVFGDIPETIKHYIDYEKLGRDLCLDGYVETPKGVFRYL